jgi:hypothetical protein
MLPPALAAQVGWPMVCGDARVTAAITGGQCSDLLYAVHRSHRWKVHRNLGMVYSGTLFHRRHRGIPMHPYENRSQIRALRDGRAGPRAAAAALPAGRRNHFLWRTSCDYIRPLCLAPLVCTRTIIVHSTVCIVLGQSSLREADPAEKDAKLAQKLGQLQPLIAVLAPECAGQLASFGPT